MKTLALFILASLFLSAEAAPLPGAEVAQPKTAAPEPALTQPSLDGTTIAVAVRDLNKDAEALRERIRAIKASLDTEDDSE